MNFHWFGNNESPSGIADFKVHGHPLVKVELSSFSHAMQLSALIDHAKQEGRKEGQRDLISLIHFDLTQEYKPLSDDRILEIEMDLVPLDTTEKVLMFAREIERMHGVTPNAELRPQAGQFPPVAP